MAHCAEAKSRAADLQQAKLSHCEDETKNFLEHHSDHMIFNERLNTRALDGFSRYAHPFAQKMCGGPSS